MSMSPSSFHFCYCIQWYYHGFIRYRFAVTLSISLILYAFRYCCNPNDSTKCGPFVTIHDNKRFFPVYICFVIFRATRSLLRHIVAESDQPLLRSFCCKKLPRFLVYVRLTYKNVTTLYSLQLVAYIVCLDVSKNAKKKTYKRRSHVP